MQSLHAEVFGTAGTSTHALVRWKRTRELVHSFFLTTAVLLRILNENTPRLSGLSLALQQQYNATACQFEVQQAPSSRLTPNGICELLRYP
jgi:hypothetical protein